MTATRTIEDYVNLERCVDTLEDERLLLIALLREWHGMFAPCRREGTEGASLIDRTAMMLQLGDMIPPPKAPERDRELDSWCPSA